MPCDFLPVLLDVPSGTPEASLSSGSRGTPRAKKRLKLAELSCGCSGLFPVREGHKLIQNFLQSLEPPFLVGGCPSVSPVHLRAVRFTNLGYFFPKFLDAL